MKTLAKTSGPKIRVNSVSPGLLLTLSERLSHISSEFINTAKEWGLQFPQSKVDKTIEKSVLKRVATVEVTSR